MVGEGAEMNIDEEMLAPLLEEAIDDFKRFAVAFETLPVDGDYKRFCGELAEVIMSLVSGMEMAKEELEGEE